MLRGRDFAALIVAVILWRTREPADSVKASIFLKFYLPAAHVAPAPLDVDGDGRPDMLAVLSDKLKLYDMRFMKAGGAPKLPKLLYEATPTVNETPLALATGHVPTKTEAAPEIQSDDRTRHYFCGKDWHDAAKCGQPCPKGVQDECPEGETCFADTPCDSKKLAKKMKIDGEVTPAGGIPAIFTLWEGGILTMHTLRSIQEGNKQLHLQELWKSTIIENVINWEDTSITYVDHMDSGTSHGLVIISSYLDQIHNDNEREVLLVVAVEALTGEVIWSSLQEREEQDRLEELPYPMRGETSVARRRSMVPLQQQYSHANCLHSGYRLSIMNKVFPASYFSESDTFSKVVHFDRQTKTTAKHLKKINAKEGKPNVVVTYNQLGLQVRSLKNGRSICHVRLLDDTLYGDFNRDTVVDSLSYLVGDHEETDASSSRAKFVNHLVQRFGRKIENTAVSAFLCHAQARSGIPSREELFSAKLCDPEKEDDELSPAPPLAVEGVRGYDLVVALSNGRVERLRGRNGHVMWELDGSRYKDFPVWEEHHLVATGRIDAPGIRSHSRPVVLTGENSIALISAKHGNVLSTAAIPQTPTSKPQLVDWNGDGTTDVIVMTTDAVWGYTSIVHIGSPIWFSLCSGFLILAMMLALLRNRFGPKPGKRGSDA